MTQCDTKQSTINKIRGIYISELKKAKKRGDNKLSLAQIKTKAEIYATNKVDRDNAEAIQKDLADSKINITQEEKYILSLPLATRTIVTPGNSKNIKESLRIENIGNISPGVAKLVYYTATLRKRVVTYINTVDGSTRGEKAHSFWDNGNLRKAHDQILRKSILAKKAKERFEAKNKTLFSQSAKEQVKLSKAHVELKNKLWNNPDEAKELFRILHDIDGGEKTEYIEKMEQLLSDITESSSPILNEFKVYVDKTAKENAGMVNLNKKGSELILNINETSDTLNGDMTAVEAYMHELIHLSVEFAKTYKKGSIFQSMNELVTLHEQARKEISWEDLVIEGDEQRAKDLWDTMFNNGTKGVSEFIAVGMTNERMINLLKDIVPKNRKEYKRGEGMWNTISYYVVKIFEAVKDLITEGHGLTGDERLRYLAGRLWEHNSMTIDKHKFTAQITGAVNKTFDVANKVIKTTVLSTSAVVMAGVNKTEDLLGDGFITNTLKFTTGMASLLNPWMDKAQIAARNKTMTQLSKMLDGKNDWLGLGGLLAPEGTIMSLVNMLSQDDDLTTEVEKYGLINQKIDGTRFDTITTVGQSVFNAFGGNLSHNDQIALTDVLVKTDMQVLTDVYDTTEIGKILNSNKYTDMLIENELSNLTELISDKKHMNYIKSQMLGLAKYMNTGVSDSTLEKTAKEIFYLNGVSTEITKSLKMTPKANHNEAIAIIDRIVSLEAINGVNKNKKVRVSTLSNKFVDGIETVLMIHKMYVVKNRQFELDNKTNTGSAKGEIKDTRQAGLESEIAEDTEVAHKNMLRLGYKKVGKSGVDGYNVYTKITSDIENFTKQALAKINVNKKLHNFIGVKNRSAHDKTDFEKYKSEIEAELLYLRDKSGEEVKRQMETGEAPKMDGYNQLVTYSARDSAFVVTNYGISIPDSLATDKFKMDNKAPILLGRMTAEVDEKRMAKALNLRVYETMLRDERNYTGVEYSSLKNDYIEIGVDATTQGITEESFSKSLFDGMPDDIRKKVMQRPKGKRFIAVRRDLARMYFGSRDPSILKAKIPFTKGQTVGDQFKKLGMYDVTKKVFDTVGLIMSEIASLEKVDIVIKTPKVVQDNIISNFNYSVALGQNPLSVAEGQSNMFLATKQYMDAKKLLNMVELELQVSMLRKDNDKIKDLGNKRKELKIRMKLSPVHKLMEAGLFTTIVEDVKNKDLHTDSRVTQFIDSNGVTSFVSDNTPQILKDGLNTTFITEDTGLFKTLLMATQYSDFVARANRYNYLIETVGVDEDVAIKMILDEHVNYNRIDSPLISWLSKFFYLRFFKYFVGSNKSLIANVKKDPARILSMATLLDGPNPSEASILEKNYSYMFEGPFDTVVDGVPAYIMPPSLLEAVGLWGR